MTRTPRIKVDSNTLIDQDKVRYAYEGYTVSLEYSAELKAFNLNINYPGGNKFTRVAVIKRKEITGNGNLLKAIRSMMVDIMPDTRFNLLEAKESTASALRVLVRCYNTVAMGKHLPKV